jgi:hypothetical protein
MSAIRWTAANGIVTAAMRRLGTWAVNTISLSLFALILGVISSAAAALEFQPDITNGHRPEELDRRHFVLGEVQDIILAAAQPEPKAFQGVAVPMYEQHGWPTLT